MTGFVWVHEVGTIPRHGQGWRSFVDTVEEGLHSIRITVPDPPPLAAIVVLDCDAGRCLSRIQVAHAPSVAVARQAAARRNGWFTRRRNGRLRDMCQLHARPTRPSPAPESEAAPEQGPLF